MKSSLCRVSSRYCKSGLRSAGTNSARSTFSARINSYKSGGESSVSCVQRTSFPPELKPRSTSAVKTSKEKLAICRTHGEESSR